MAPTPRIEEIADRLAEMRLALPGLADRSPNALRFLSRELEEIVAECSDWSGRWRTLLESAEVLTQELDRARQEARQIHTED